MIDRIQSRSVFLRLRAEGTHVRSGLLSCTMLVDASLTHPQVGYALGRSFGSAVRRNRLRRQLREIVKTREHLFSPGIYVFGASPKARNLKFGELEANMDRLLSQIAKKVAS